MFQYAARMSMITRFIMAVIENLLQADDLAAKAAFASEKAVERRYSNGILGAEHRFANVGH